jgi:hypothetical protein
MRVTKSLGTALEYIQDDDDVILWVDSICINQQDSEEKRLQVQEMGKIYRNAFTTIVWLGVADNSSDMTIYELKTIGKHLEEDGIADLIYEAADLPSAEQEKYHAVEANMNDKLRDILEFAYNNLQSTYELLEGAAALAARPYWTRVWILQEYALSRDIQIKCGGTTIPMQHFRAAITFINLMKVHVLRRLRDHFTKRMGEGEVIEPMLQKQFFDLVKAGPTGAMFYLQGLRNRCQIARERGQESPHSLIGILGKIFVGTPHEATDPRDRVFALLGLANDAEKLGIKPAYDESVTHTDVYITTARAIISTGNVDLLCFVQHRNANTTLPSWVADWGGKDRQPDILCPSGQEPWNTSFSASGTQLFQIPSTFNSLPATEISLYGYLIDEVEAVASPWNSGIQNHEDISKYLSEISQLCDESDAKFASTTRDVYEDPATRSTARFLVPTADQERYGVGFVRRATATFSRDGHAQVLEEISRNRAGQLIRGPPPAEMHSYYGALRQQYNRRPFLSEKGYVGLAPDTARVGDQAVILLGSKFTYVVRRIEGTFYRLVGEAYVHGIMYGEYLTRDRILDEFILR